MAAPSSWKTLSSGFKGRLKRLRSAFLRWPAWLKGGLVFGTALVLFNALAALSYLSYRWQLDASRQIPLSQELIALCDEAADQLREARNQEQAYLGRQKGGSLRAYQEALIELNNRLAKLRARANIIEPGQDHEALLKLGTQLFRMSKGSTAKPRDNGGVELLGVHIERSQPQLEKSRRLALATAKEEAKLAAIQGGLHDLKSRQELLVKGWDQRNRSASRIFNGSILLGNLLAFVLISLGGHSLMFHISLSESSIQALHELQQFADAAAEPVYGVDPEGRCVFCNRALLRLLGYQNAEELKGSLAHRLVFAPPPGKEEPESARELLRALAEGKQLHGTDSQAWKADGSGLNVEYWCNPVHLEGRLLGAAVTLQDVSAARASAQKMQEAYLSLQGQVRDLSKHSQEMSAFSELTEMLQASTSSDELCRVVSVFAKQFFSQEAGALYLLKGPGKQLEPVSTWGEPSLEGQAFLQQDCWSLRRAKPHYEEVGKEGLFCAHLPAELPDFSLCLPLIAQGGALGVLHLRASAGRRGLRLSEPKQLLAVALAQQVALGLSNLKLRDFLREDSIRDSLTGLYNRRYMKESLDHEISRAERNKGTVGLITFDLDHFKEVNDRRGHAAGDKLLHALGDLVKDSVRGEDSACRYGGDEFLLILPGIQGAQALILAEALRKKVETLLPELGRDGKAPCTLSVGLALYPEDAGNADDLQLAADRALYRAKALGRNRVVRASSPGSA